MAQPRPADISSDLLEDFGDEWVTKIMFHYRWYYAPDRAFAQDWVITSRDPQMPQAERREAMQAFNDRQVGRMAMVGCTDGNRPVIEDSYRFILDTLDAHVRKMEFLFGSRPSLAAAIAMVAESLSLIVSVAATLTSSALAESASANGGVLEGSKTSVGSTMASSMAETVRIAVVFSAAVAANVTVLLGL